MQFREFIYTLSTLTLLAGLSANALLAQDEVDSPAVNSLKEWLSVPASERPELSEQPFASTPLSKEQANVVLTLLWNDTRNELKASRSDSLQRKIVVLGEKEMKYDYRIFGEAPEGGHSLFISMHGGGNAPPAVNDRQWQNQIGLYEPKEGVYVAPRAPTNTWNLWHEKHIDPMFDQLIADFVAVKGINPNRVYLMGYSAGGDGVYQLAPRMADRFAAAAMMAGHPNETKPDGLRNLPFTLHMGGKDGAYKRSKIAGEWKEKLSALRKAESDPAAYIHHVEIHEEMGHWMKREDAVAVPWMAKFDRNPWPKKIIWLQDDVTHERFYWLAVAEEHAAKRQRIEAEVEGQEIRLKGQELPDEITLRLNDLLIDLDKPVKVLHGEAVLHDGTISRSISALARSFKERADSGTAASALLAVSLAAEGK